MGKEAVAQQNRDGISPFGIRRGVVASEFRPVHDVIVDERGDVDELENHSQIDMARGDFSRCASRKEGEGRAKAFSPSPANIRHIALDGRIKQLGLSADAFLDGVEVGVDELKCFREGNLFGFRSSGTLGVIVHRE